MRFCRESITRHRSTMVPYYPKELFVHEQVEKYFSDNSLSLLHPQKQTITKPKSVLFSLSGPGIPSNNEPSSPMV